MSPSETESAKAGVFKTCSSPNNKYDKLYYLQYMQNLYVIFFLQRIALV